MKYSRGYLKEMAILAFLYGLLKTSLVLDMEDIDKANINHPELDGIEKETIINLKNELLKRIKTHLDSIRNKLDTKSVNAVAKYVNILQDMLYRLQNEQQVVLDYLALVFLRVAKNEDINAITSVITDDDIKLIVDIEDNVNAKIIVSHLKFTKSFINDYFIKVNHNKRVLNE